MEIAIIGGGITGLTTGIALARQGIEATVYERAPQIQTVGAGIWLQPNAIKVLSALGLKEQLLERGAVLHRADITNSQLRPFKETANIISDADGHQTLAIHRGRLQAVLKEHVEKDQRLELGRRFVQSKGSSRIQVVFENGEIEADMLLGCDGLHSAVRRQLFPNARLRQSGQICWRGVVTFDLEPMFRNRGFEAWGGGLRFGVSGISEREVYWFAVAKASHVPEVYTPEDLAALYDGFHPMIPQLIRSTRSFHTDHLADLRRLSHWHHREQALLGDAAHATTPNMGQGACQGIEDAYYMAHLLKKSGSPSEAFTEFERLRRKKVDYIVNTSWRFGKMAHSAIWRRALPVMMKLTPEKVVTKQLQDLYHLQGI